MITSVTLTVDNNQFELKFNRNVRDTSGTYKLIRYKLPNDNDLLSAIGNVYLVSYMSEYQYMTSTSYMASSSINPVNLWLW